MSQPTLRANPAEISSTLKEAVVDSLLNLTYAQLSGQGEAGECSTKDTFELWFSITTA